MFFLKNYRGKVLAFVVIALNAIIIFSALDGMKIIRWFRGGGKVVQEVKAEREGYFGKLEEVRKIIAGQPKAREILFKVKNWQDAEKNGLLNSKKFSTGNYKYKYIFYGGHINYFDEKTGEILEIDATFEKDVDGSFVIRRANYFARAPVFSDEKMEFLFRGSSLTFTPKRIGEISVGHVPGAMQGNKIIYADAFGQGIDYVIEAEPDELKKLVVFRKPPENLSEDIRIEFQTSLSGTGKIQGKNTEIQNFFFREPAVWDSSDIRENIAIEFENNTFTKIIPLAFFKHGPDAKPIVYPVTTDVTTSYYAGAGDGYVYYSTGSQSWATAHAETGDNNVTADYGTNPDGNIAIAGSRSDQGGSKMYRAFLPIDTSGIADNDEITAARLKIYTTAFTSIDPGDGNDYVVVVQTSAVSTSSLTGEDYDQCGSVTNPTQGSGTLTLDGTLLIPGYNTLTLNSTGEGWISKTGTTQLGLREGHDAVNDPLTNSGASDITFRISDNDGTSEDPYLEVDTTAAVISSVTTQRTIFATSTANVIVSSSITGETAASSTLEYVLFLDEDADATPDTNETYVTGDCAGSGAWSSGAYTYVKSNFQIADGESPKTHSWECANTQFPENGLYTIYLTWKDANGTIDTDSATTFQSCDQPTSTNNWNDTNYENRIILNFRSATFSEALLQFPALIKATSTNFGFDDPDSSANDVKFVDGLDDGETTLSYEREFYDSTTTLEGYWWVQVPKIATSTDCDYIQMYYDYAGAANSSSSTAPWRQDYYEAVWHFGETATPTTYNFQEGVSPDSSYTGGEGVVISSGSAGTNLINYTGFQADWNGATAGSCASGICRVLMQWDISSITSCTVTSASTTINVTNATADKYSVYALRQNWTETGATWNSYSSGNSWALTGASSTVSDFYNTDLMNGNSDGGWGKSSTGSVTHGFDSDGISTLQDWINGTVTNNGIIVRDTYFASPQDDDGYAWSTTTDSTTSNRPKLTINCGGNVDTYLDSTLNNHDETNSDIASRKEKSKSKFGYSPKFNGSSSVLGIPDSTGFDLGSYTITGWLYREGAGDPATFSRGQTIVPIIGKGYAEADTAAADIQFALGVDNGGATYLGANFEDNRNASGNDWAFVAGPGISNSAWRHVGFRVKGSGVATLYMDGFKANTTTYAINQTPSTGGTQKVGIGTVYNTAGTSDGKWQGYLDEIRMYKTNIPTSTASDNSVWLRAEWFTADNGYVQWGTEATNTVSLSITASTTVEFPSVNYSFFHQSSTATNVGGLQVSGGGGTWTLNISCQDNSIDCVWKGQKEVDRFSLYLGMRPTGTNASSTGLFCHDGTSGYNCDGTCTGVTLTQTFSCFPSNKADITIATGSSASGTYWLAESEWVIGIPWSVSASVYTTTLTYDLQ